MTEEHPDEEPTPAPKLTKKDRSVLEQLRNRGPHAYNEGDEPPSMVKLHELGMAERKMVGPRMVYSVVRD